MYREYPAPLILSELEHDDLLPCILFRTSRKACDHDVERLAKSRVGKMPTYERKVLRKAVEKAIAKYDLDQEVIYEHPHYEALLKTGAGAHHAGQLLVWRLLLEELMSNGALRMLVATGTVAAGVDFPARTAVVTAHSKRGSEGFRVLTSSEFQQMSGRAGRRGKDTVGICLVAPSTFSDARVIYEVSKRPPEPLRSAYFASPSTVLNLLKYRSEDDLRFTVERSLAAFLDRKHSKGMLKEADELEAGSEDEELTEDRKKKIVKRARRKRKEAEALAERQQKDLEVCVRGLKALGHADDNGLTDKGLWAAELCTSLVLDLAEAIHDGVFFELQPEELAGLVASISGDSYRQYLRIRKNPIKKEYFEQLQMLVKRVRENYHGNLTHEGEVIVDASSTVITWMESESWSEFSSLLRLSGAAEGDVARLITQTADQLNQIARLRESHPDLAKQAAETRERLLRPPIVDTIPEVA